MTTRQVSTAVPTNFCSCSWSQRPGNSPSRRVSNSNWKKPARPRSAGSENAGARQLLVWAVRKRVGSGQPRLVSVFLSPGQFFRDVNTSGGGGVFGKTPILLANPRDRSGARFRWRLLSSNQYISSWYLPSSSSVYAVDRAETIYSWLYLQNFPDALPKHAASGRLRGTFFGPGVLLAGRSVSRRNLVGPQHAFFDER